MSDERSVQSPVTGRWYKNVKAMKVMDRIVLNKMRENAVKLKETRDNALLCICNSDEFMVSNKVSLKDTSLICVRCGRSWSVDLLRDKYIKECLEPEFLQHQDYSSTGTNRGSGSATNYTDKDLLGIKYGLKDYKEAGDED